MQLWPFQPPPRTLRTRLRVEECLRRLNDDVIRSWPLANWTGVSPIKRDRAATRDQLVFRAIDGDRIRLHLEGGRANNRYIRYVFDGSLRTEADCTTITGQYQLQRISFVGLLMLYSLAALTLVIAAMTIVVALRDAASAWQGVLLGVGFVIGAVALLAWIPSREHVLTDERLIVESIKRVLEADE